MAESERHYRSFLLRLWRAGDGAASEWRVVLEDVITGERHAFTDLASLVRFLDAVIRAADSPVSAANQEGY